MKIHNTDGGSTTFYDIDGCKDVDDLCSHWNLTWEEGCILKSIVGRAKARNGINRHIGTDGKRDTNKIKHYANRLK